MPRRLAAIVLDVRARSPTIVIGDAISGPYKITVLAAHQPFDIGQNGLRIHIAEASTARPIPDSQVLLTVAPIGRHGIERTFSVPPAADAGGGIYAGTIDLPSRGAWRISTRVASSRGLGDSTLVAQAGKATPLRDALKISIPPLTLTLLAAHFARRERRARRRAARTIGQARNAGGGRRRVSRESEA